VLAMTFVDCDGGMAQAPNIPATPAGSVNNDFDLVEQDEEFTQRFEGDYFGLNVHPVPSDLFVNIDFYLATDTEISITVYNALGQIYEQSNTTYSSGKNNTMLDISQYPTGIYYLNVLSTDRMQTIEFIKN